MALPLTPPTIEPLIAVFCANEEKNCPPGYIFIRDETWEKKDYSSSDEMSPFVYNFLMEKFESL